MITGNAMWLNIAILAASAAGFVCLALASERQGEALLKRLPGRRDRWVFRGVGWPLLVLALLLCILGSSGSIGPVAWLGWLTAAGAGLVFTLPRWTERRKAGKTMPATRPLPVQRPLLWRGLLLAALIGGPLVFAWHLREAAIEPVMRYSALQGQAGPWALRLAEVDRQPPRRLGRDMPVRALQLRFCNACENQIRTAHLTVHRPGPLETEPTVFEPASSLGTRSAQWRLPRDIQPDSLVWLNVEGYDGSQHQVSWRFEELAPATARWLQTQQINGR